MALIVARAPVPAQSAVGELALASGGGAVIVIAEEDVFPALVVLQDGRNEGIVAPLYNGPRQVAMRR